MKKYLLLIIILLFSIATYAQKVNGAFGLETAHLWRGFEISNGLTLTGDMSYSFNKNIKVGLWGGRQIDGQYREFDYYAAYNTCGLTLSLWDIYNYSGHEGDKWADIFNYDQYTTGHFIDLGAAYDFGSKCNFPLVLSWNTIVLGRDMDGKTRQFSTFVKAASKSMKMT